MYYKFKKGKQKKLFSQAIAKAGSERKLAKLSGIPKGSISDLKLEKRVLSENYAKKVCNFLNINLEDMNYEKILPHNWAQVKGGKKLIELKKQRGEFQETVERLRKVTHQRLVKWHREMKKNKPEEYYKKQYERFKKVNRGYQFSLKNGIKVRNKLEQKVGNFLYENFKKIEYEPYFNFDGKAYFPDFKYKKVLVEVTEWKHPTEKRIQMLLKKTKDYKKAGFVICFYVPRVYRKFYKFLNSPVITNLSELKDFITASVA